MKEDASAADPLTQMMASSDPLIRVRAVEGLAVVQSDDATATLLTALSDPEPAVVDAAKRAVEHAQPAVLVNAIIGVLGWGDPTVAQAVDAALPALRDTLDGPLSAVFTAKDSPRVKRMAAAYCLGRIGTKRAGESLAKEIWGDDLALAYYCADAMITLDDPRLLRDLIRMTEHPQVRMRAAAYLALSRIGGDDARHALTEAAAGRTEPDTAARKIAIRMLGHIGNAETVDVLITLVRAQNALVRPATDALSTMTGLPQGMERERWLEWYDEVYTPQKAAFENRSISTQKKVDKKNVPIGFPADGFPFKP